MADIIRNRKHQGDSPTVSGMESFAGRIPTTQRRIIKSRQTHITSVLKEISPEEHACGAPKIVPLRGVRGVEGVEITCRCGETIVIHFELDNVDISHGS